jgi:hypothetical protein
MLRVMIAKRPLAAARLDFVTRQEHIPQALQKLDYAYDSNT